MSEPTSRPRRTREPRLADAAARQLIAERLDLNLLVEAGAGSGKTYSLARRMAAGIVSGKYVVEELAAVTFTRKAAAELRGRFQLALEEMRAGADGDGRARIDKALANLEHLFAGTIHSFCAHLLRERPVEANIAPGFTELDELEDAGIRERAWRDYLSRLRGERSPLLDELQEARVSAKDLDRAFGIVCTFDEVEFPAGDAARPEVKEARKAAESFWRKLQALMPESVARDAKCKALERARRFRGLFRTARGGRPADLAEALRCWEKTPDVTMKWWAPTREKQLEVRQKVRDLVGEFVADVVDPFLEAWRHYLYRLVVTLLTGARESARDERRRALALNYGDLLTSAAALLRGNASVRAALQKKYRWLFVDEFQDTDPIQAEVILLLAADEQAGSGPAGAEIDPYSVPLRPGALFVVGDPKQSIFRFRRADIEIYRHVREAIRRSGGEIVSLTTSFRARPSLCEWNNGVFEDLLPAAATSQQAAFSRLDPDPDWKPRPAARGAKASATRGESGLRILTVPETVTKGDVAAWDAEAIARFIRAEVDAGRAGWADFLVLTRKKKHLADYAAALQARRIPVEVSGAGAFGGPAVVRALVDLLHVLGDPADALGVVGVLRGPLFGISDPQLFEHRQNGGFFGFPATRAGQPSAAARGGPSEVVRALDCLGEFLRLTRTLPLAAAVERILEDSGFLALAAASAEGAGPAGDVLHGVDLVRAVTADGGSLADAAAALEQAAESADVESVPLEPGRREVVRVMNLHKAKGLEAPVVFLADPLGAAKKEADRRIVREGRIARGYFAINRDLGEYQKQLIAHPPDWDQYQAEELVYINAEETRLLYVAATRARELLVVSRWASDANGRGPWADLDRYLVGAPELEIPASRPAAGKREITASAAARDQAATARMQRYKLACEPSWAVTSVTDEKAGLSAVAREGGGGKAERREGGKADWPPAAHRVDAGPAWGSLVHGLLEYAARHGDVARGDLQRLAGWLTVETPELRPVIPEALDLVEKVAHAPFWDEARAGGEVSVEVPFAVRIAPRGSLGRVGPVALSTVLHGVIDLVYRAPDGWRILDYKTDVAAAPGQTLLERHASQLAQYRAAWEQITGAEVARTGIVGVREGTVEWE